MTHHPLRPRSVTFTLWGVFLFGAWNAAKVWAFSQQGRYLSELDIMPSPQLLLRMALFWAVCFGLATVLLQQKRPLARPLIPLLLLTYGVYEWGLVTVFAQTTVHWTMSGMVIGSCTLFSYWALHRKESANFFKN